MLSRAVLFVGAMALMSGVAAAQEAPAPVPWTLTGTSAAPAATPRHRVEGRLFSKDGRVLVRAGFSYLSRGDLYNNPGVSLEGSYYLYEFLAIDVVSATLFFPQLTQSAVTLREQTGLLPDSQRLRARVAAGGRFSFAYGKALIERLDTVLHFDASLGLHVGAMITDDAVNFVGDVGLAAQVRVFEHLLVWLDGAWLVGNEARTTSNVASGFMGTVGVGWAF